MGTRKIWALAGGKGGAGRTLLAANLGIALARSGRRVVLVDFDPEGGDLHSCLGFARRPRGLAALAQDPGAPFAGLAVDTPIHNLRLIAGLGTRRPENAAALPPEVAPRVAELAADQVVLDCGSGRSTAVLDAFQLGDLGVVVATPEPSALESACQFAEAHLRRCLERALPDDSRRALHDLLAAEGVDLSRLPFRSLMLKLGALDPAARDNVAQAARRVRMELILNQVRDEADEEAGPALASAYLKAFGLALPIAGLVAHDPSVLQSVHKRRPLAQQFPNTPATKAIARAAERLLHAATVEAEGADPEWDDLAGLDHYRILELVPKASSKEIQAAYQILRRAFGMESTPLLPLLNDDDLRAVQTRVEDAYRSLIFLESRVAYDKHLVETGALRADQVRGLHDESADPPAAPDPAPTRERPAGVAPEPQAAPAGPESAVPEAAAPPAAAPGMGPAPAAAAIPEAAPPAPRQVPLTGEALRAERERLGLSLETISARTKIRQAFLVAIEEERWDRLPSPVFLRGFVREIAACLALPVDEVARALLARRDRALAPPLEDPATKTA